MSEIDKKSELPSSVEIPGKPGSDFEAAQETKLNLQKKLIDEKDPQEADAIRKQIEAIEQTQSTAAGGSPELASAQTIVEETQILSALNEAKAYDPKTKSSTEAEEMTRLLGQ